MIGIGAPVGNYLVRSVLGEGGMGIVYLAEHPLIGRRVAIKVIHPDFAENPEAVSRFFTEAQAVNRIGHPNIVDITDYGQTPQGEAYFVMEFLAGESLSARQRRAPLGLGEALHVAWQIADALAASHAAGILHRDLKPDNVFLLKQQRDPLFVKVLDFGLAKLTGDPGAAGAPGHKTRAGTVMGTPHYMSPEQCQGRPDIDARADIYALGIMLFEMVTGQVPFTGNGYTEIILKHMMEPPPMARALLPSCPVWLEHLILQLLAKDRDYRVQTMGEVRDAIAWGMEQDGLTPQAMRSGGSGMTALPTPPPAPGPRANVSTLGLSTGEATAVGDGSRPARRGSRGKLLAVVGALVVGGAATGIVVGQKHGHPGANPMAAASPAAPVAPAPAPAVVPAPAQPPPASPPARTPAPVPALPAPAAPAAAAAADDGMIVLHLDSDPAGAEILLAGGTPLGTAPFDWKLVPSGGKFSVTFKLAGREPRTVVVTAKESATVKVSLPPAQAAPRPRPAVKPSSSGKSDKPAADGDLLAPR
jgi:eukaryotic-like serine/threonine-protein kinase